jgi:hypothetical protein
MKVIHLSVMVPLLLLIYIEYKIAVLMKSHDLFPALVFALKAFIFLNQEKQWKMDLFG